jgi:hypothetical protein
MSLDPNLQQMLEQLGRLYEIVLELGRDIAPRNPALYEIMAEGPVDQIEQIRRQIDEAVGLASLLEHRADVWLDIEGEGIDVQSAPSSLLAAYLDVVRKGVQEVAEANAQGRRPAKDLQQACDLELVALQPGSIRIGLRLPDDEIGEEPEFHLTASRRAASEALVDYLEVADWAAREGDEAWLRERFPQPEKRRALLGAVKSLAPGGRSAVERVSLSGRRMPSPAPATLTRSARRHLGDALKRLEEPRLGAYEGVLREIDLDKRTFLLREAGPEHAVRCSFPAPLSALAKQALDHRVRAVGTVQKAKGRRGTIDLKVRELVILDS